MEVGSTRSAQVIFWYSNKNPPLIHEKGGMIFFNIFYRTFNNTSHDVYMIICLNDSCRPYKDEPKVPGMSEYGINEKRAPRDCKGEPQAKPTEK